jgi:hypothetical protein
MIAFTILTKNMSRPKIIGLFVITIRRKAAYYWHSDHIAISDMVCLAVVLA